MLIRSLLHLVICCAVLGTFACQRADINNNEAVRSAVVAYIASRGDLSLTDLDISVRNVSFQGDRCEAEVLFSPKGQGPENSMTMQYELERDGAVWKVKPKAPGAHAATPQGGVPAPPTGETPPLPAGHPPVAPQGGAAQ